MNLSLLMIKIVIISIPGEIYALASSSRNVVIHLHHHRLLDNLYALLILLVTIPIRDSLKSNTKSNQ